jgi:hypothetical protein
MNERVIFSIVKNGSDAFALGSLIEALLLGGLFIFVTLRLRSAKRNVMCLSREPRDFW